MKYIFILGHNPTLSCAEISTVLDTLHTNYTIIGVSNEALAIETKKVFEKDAGFIDRLGGTIKIAKIISEEENNDNFSEIFQKEPGHNLLKSFIDEQGAIAGKKQHWGLSVYFLSDKDQFYKKDAFKNAQRSLFKAKREFTKEKISIRIVIPPKGGARLDSAAVFNNKLLTKGGEIIVLANNDKIYLARTIAVQNFESYALRDYGRPARDMKIGMMPPKLAQVMLNLAQIKKDGTVLDPFCGTGVILQEALLMGYRAIGSDILDMVLEYSRKNLKWLEESFKINNAKYDLFKRDARDVSKIIENGSIDAIVTEGTLGPKYANQGPENEEMRRNFQQLEALYAASFKEFYKVLKKGAKIVITFPFYRFGEQKIVMAPFIDKIRATGYNILCPIKDCAIKEYPAIHLTDRNTILYDRSNQMVGREIVIFSKR